VVTFVTANLYAKEKVRKSITATSAMLHDFMIEERGNIEIFPKEYAEISAQMSDIKQAMQRHEQMLKEEASRKNDLIAYLAHDLKTPLTSVIGYLALLDEAQDMPIEQKTKYVNIALSKALRLEKLINEFFDITRYNLQQIDLEKESINLCHMLIQMTDEFYPLLNAHGNQTEVCVDEDITVYGDSIKLARVFNNILKNAIAYSYPDTIIKIWAESTATDVWIYFCNKGKTIPAGKLNSIFEKFFRMDEARSTNTGGAGLGLAIAKEIITLHGGKITAESENESTTFRISLSVTH
jgi:two-component system sensor histidine kinase VanS